MVYQQKEKEENGGMASSDEEDGASVVECSSYQHSEQEEEGMESSCSSSDTTNYEQSSSNAANKPTYMVLTNDQLEGMMKSMAEEVAPIVGCGPAECMVMLRHTDWNKDKLLEKLFDNSCEIIASTSSTSSTQSSTGQCCEICFEENDDQLRALQCNHYFCNKCWTEHITSKISVGLLKSLLCPASKCSQMIGDQLILELLHNHLSVRQLYRKIVLNQFVECTKSLKWCPWQDCNLAVQVSNSSSSPKVHCSCGFTFCFGCSKEWHQPVMCKMLQMWLARCEDDSETFNWINANTKDCPKCKSPIEKNGGCNRIVCGKSSCHYQFCWSCLKDWNVHGYNASCNKFDEEEAQKATGSRVSLQRYLHYYNRFTNHKASLKLEAKLSEEVENKMLQLQKLNFSYVETQFLLQSVQILSECRRTLMYTYALGFYLLPSNAKQLFEDNQQDLEVATEQLSEFLERDMDQEEQGENSSLQFLSQKVKDKAGYVHKRRLVLEEQCLESTEKKMFVFDKTLTNGIKF